jgi:dienelactone hydrolase
MSKGDASLLKCGVICHPSPEGKDLYGAITFPTQWHLASHDMRFKDPQIAELRQAVEKKSDVITEITVHPGESEVHCALYPSVCFGMMRILM